jgi:hypothetical protein
MRRRIVDRTYLRKSVLLMGTLLAAVVILMGSTPAFAQWGDIGLYADAAGTDCNIVVPAPGNTFTYYVIHKNIVGATGSQFYAPVPPGAGFIVLTDIPQVGVYIGSTQTGVSAGYGSCVSGDLVVTQVFAQATGSPTTCAQFPVLPHPLADIPGEIVVADCDTPIQSQIGQARFATIAGDGSCACGLNEYSVINTNDSGAGSLRDAITQANSSPGLERIVFDIPGGGPHTIQLLSALPVITDPVEIDGYTQSGAFANTNPLSLGSNAQLMIELDGTSAGATAIGLHLGGSGSTVKGLVINRFLESGIRLSGGGSHIIEGNFIGTDVAGTAGLANNGGVFVDNSPANRIGGISVAARNIISGNDPLSGPADGILILGSGATGNLVQGNLIGVDATGVVALGNSNHGVRLWEGCDGNTIGGTTAGAGNVISGNGFYGLGLIPDWPSTAGVPVDGTVVLGNFIGTDGGGSVDLGNAGGGVFIVGSNNTIGGLTPAASNLVSGNDGYGISIADTGSGSTGNQVLGNLIGTDLSGTSALGNSVVEHHWGDGKRGGKRHLRQRSQWGQHWRDGEPRPRQPHRH